ncbi:hypothetical protein NYR66_02200 [Actinobacillus equuli subsp. haemolyticus]|nr:hypothetical protein [Actinobacillus equuli]WGE81824.1 hypothetical protein NYR66_02200 [Actinobacillus equuli subsp. haemolyticus]
MRNVILDLLGLTGLGLLCSGIYLKYGLEVTLMCAGILLLLLVIFASRGK